MSQRKRYAIVGTGSRAGMFIEAITCTYADSAELVALCDLSHTRMAWHNRQLARLGIAAIPSYHAGDFEKMIQERQPHSVIVATVDAAHHHYIIRAMESGCDVICEKPLTTTLDRLRAIDAAIRRKGKILARDFQLSIRPGLHALQATDDGRRGGAALGGRFLLAAGYQPRRRLLPALAPRESAKRRPAVHKATHHFDLVNWWIDSLPSQVFAMGDLLFYGKANAEARGERYSYSRYTGEPAAADDPFALFLDQKAAFKGLYLEAEAETGYIRDRNVFGEGITAEDTMAVIVRYRNGALLSYNLVAYAPWEGLRVAITGARGRIELDISENVAHLKSDAASAAASKGPFQHAEMRVFPMFGDPYTVDIPTGQGGHGGADPLMLESIFADEPDIDPYGRAAGHIDGAASVLVGIAANRSIESGEMIRLDELFDLPSSLGEDNYR